MAESDSGNALRSFYEDRIGEPTGADEVYGYYVFLVGTLLATVGILWFLAASGAGPAARKQAYVLAAGGFLLLLAGAVYRLPLSPRATYAVYVGGVLSLVGIGLFAAQFPGGWAVGTPSSNLVILLYVGGIGVIAVGTLLAPTERGQTASEFRREGEITQLREEHAARQGRVEELEAERDDLEEQLAEAEAEREAASYEATAERDAREEAAARADELGAALAAAREEREAEAERAETAETRLARLEASQASFDVYRDRSGKWRWRLVHRNGNIIATSGQGYSNDRGARRGMRSVTRNALGATVVWQRDEEEPEPEPEMVCEESRATFELYEDRAGDHRFRLRHDNGNTIAAAARGFSSRSGASNAVEAVRSYIAPADYLRFDPAGIEVFEDAAGEYRWRLVHRNGTIDGVNSVKRNAPAAEAVRLDDETAEEAAEAVDTDADPAGDPEQAEGQQGGPESRE